MPVPGSAQQPSPERFFEVMNAYQQTAALKAAIELDLFTAIGEGAETGPALAQRCRASERGTRILSDYLVAMGFLSKGGSRFPLPADSAMFLDRRSPTCIASAAGFLGSPLLTEGFKDVAAAVRKGGTVISEEGTLAPEHPIWVEFARHMAPMMALPAELIAKLVGAAEGRKWKILDIAAGHGLFGITLAKHNPNAEVVAVDWPKVLEVARANAQAAGAAGRDRTPPRGALYVDYGEGLDFLLLPQFLPPLHISTFGRMA